MIFSILVNYIFGRLMDKNRGRQKRMKLLLPYDKAGYTAKLRENGKVFSEEYTENGVLVDALVDQMLITQMEQYKTE